MSTCVIVGLIEKMRAGRRYNRLLSSECCFVVRSWENLVLTARGVPPHYLVDRDPTITMQGILLWKPDAVAN